MNANYNVLRPLYLLSNMNEFKMYNDGHGLIIEAEGIKFIASPYCLEEALIESYIFIRSRIEARELVKNAKIVL